MENSPYKEKNIGDRPYKARHMENIPSRTWAEEWEHEKRENRGGALWRRNPKILKHENKENKGTLKNGEQRTVALWEACGKQQSMKNLAS